MLISKVLAIYGETPGFGEVEDEPEFEAEASDLSTLDPKAPSKVKIISTEEYAQQAA
jgi:hypothetical protein